MDARPARAGRANRIWRCVVLFALAAAIPLALTACSEERSTDADGNRARKSSAAKERQERLRERRQRARLREERLEARLARERRRTRAAARKRRQAEAALAAEQAADEEAALAAEAAAAPACHASYDPCLNPNASDYDCEGGSGDGPEYTGPVTVNGPDDYDLDADGDGSACEPY